MGVQDLYGFVLILVLVGMLIGAGLLALGSFATATGITAGASTGINQTITAIATIPSTWLPLIVTISALAIIIGLVITFGNFSGAGGGRR